MESKLEYKNIRIVKGQKRYFFGWQIKKEFKEVTEDEYKKSKLPVLKYEQT